MSGGGRGNHAWNGQNYLLSWADGVSDLTWEQARDYCHNNAMRMLSMDTQEKTEHFFKQVYYLVYDYCMTLFVCKCSVPM